MKTNILSPSKFDNFKQVVDISAHILRDVPIRLFSSPYSVIPIIGQIMGLNTALMGSGDSPYSIISLISRVKDKADYFNKAFSFSLPEKRKILDEIQEMLAPFILDEQETYIDLVAGTKFKSLISGSAGRKDRLTEALREKFSLLGGFAKKFLTGKGDFGYIVHYGYQEDLLREYSFLERMPASRVLQWRQGAYPAVNEVSIRNFPSTNAGTKTEIKGWIMFIPNYTRELLEDGKLRKRKILQAAVLAEKLGAGMIGMGGLIASFAEGGRWLSEQIPRVGFTTGHAYTIANIIEILKKAAATAGLNVRQSTTAVVGSAGSIGSGCAKLLAEEYPQRLILVDLSTFSAQKKLEGIKEYVLEKTPNTTVEISDTLADIKKADIIIVATNSPKSIIKPEHLKRGAIIIDDAFPKNVSKDLLKKRPDVLLLEGGIMQLPPQIDIYFSRNMPDLMDLPLTRAVSCKETYGCVAEIFILALNHFSENYGLGNSDPVLAKDILSKARQLHCSTATLQCFDEAVGARELRFDKTNLF